MLTRIYKFAPLRTSRAADLVLQHGWTAGGVGAIEKMRAKTGREGKYATEKTRRFSR